MDIKFTRIDERNFLGVHGYFYTGFGFYFVLDALYDAFKPLFETYFWLENSLLLIVAVFSCIMIFTGFKYGVFTGGYNEANDKDEYLSSLKVKAGQNTFLCSLVVSGIAYFLFKLDYFSQIITLEQYSKLFLGLMAMFYGMNIILLYFQEDSE